MKDEDRPLQYRKGRNIGFFIGLGIMLIPIIIIVALTMPSTGPVNSARGFSKVKVMDPSIVYFPNGTLQFTIMNGAGLTVTGFNITGMRSYYSEGTACGCTAAYCKDVGSIQIASGGTQEITMTCDQKAPRESFSVSVNVTYVEIIVGTPVTRTESGTIRGIAERA